MAFGWFKKKDRAQDSPAEEATGQAVEEAAVPEHGEPDALETESDEEMITEVDEPPAPADEHAETPKSEDEPQPESTGKKTGGFFKRLKSGLSKTRKVLTTDIDELFTGKVKVDDEMLEDLEELLITADIGVQTTMDIVERLRKKAPRISGPDDLKEILKGELEKITT